ncbi:hypothetical protein HELRODRAFT_101169 [Helobdella robusta]|uniref:G domain-containing protein n=1 Tax=Helobdella robusta TaxID=6412 RepID=T1ED34_HELRO|nr:hypothetical protein HELRODRAFT_101169 [Helobdella robusta]ESO00186.1 hypothetical protein HELRODRAFT_101169 [Helobdella robusta]
MISVVFLNKSLLHLSKLTSSLGFFAPLRCHSSKKLLKSSLKIIENKTNILVGSNVSLTDTNHELSKFDGIISTTNTRNPISVFVSDTDRDSVGEVTEDKNELEQLKNGAASNKVFECFGTPDPSQPVSDVACPGCGALLHCKNSSLPGYLPSQTFLSVPSSHLKYVNCQRCYLLEEKNILFNTTVKQKSYRHFLTEMKQHTALILLVVDMTDLSNSFHSLFKYLTSSRRPMFIIGNKVDLLYKDKDGYLTRAKKSLVEIAARKGFNKENNVQEFFLVSSQTGFGIEDLITKILNFWRLKGQIYLVGTANSGKSTLFNSLLASDLCRSSAKEVIGRATTSIWPGTTLNFLKFPIMNPKPSKLHERYERLKKQKSSDSNDLVEEKMLMKSRKNMRPNLIS